MTPSHPLHSTIGCQILETQELLKQATNIVNPNSGIANDFLNQYNEILLLVENLPVLLPEMVEDLLAWRPRSYEEYFKYSPLPGSEIAVKIYQNLDLSFRKKFEVQVAKLNKLAAKAVTVIGKHDLEADELCAEDIERFCGEISKQIRAEIEKASAYVNHGLEFPPETSQAMADRLMSV